MKLNPEPKMSQQVVVSRSCVFLFSLFLAFPSFLLFCPLFHFFKKDGFLRVPLWVHLTLKVTQGSLGLLLGILRVFRITIRVHQSFVRFLLGFFGSPLCFGLLILKSFYSSSSRLKGFSGLFFSISNFYYPQFCSNFTYDCNQL